MHAMNVRSKPLMHQRLMAICSNPANLGKYTIVFHNLNSLVNYTSLAIV